MKIVKITPQACVLNALGGVERHNIDKVNWKADFPEKPNVDFAIAHDGNNLYINFRVNEEMSLGTVTEDNGAVWTDSCVEFFVSFDDDGYYNFEFNCIGSVLMAFRKERKDARSATAELLSKISRCFTLERAPFAEKHIDEWQLTVIIPKELFFCHSIDNLSGIKATANFYKCGDNLSKPHFLSWNPICNLKPNFHLPQYFGEIEFE